MNVKQLLKVVALGLALALLVQPHAAYADGPTPVGPEFRVNTYTTDPQEFPSVAMDADGNFVVAWWSWDQDGSGYGVYAQRYYSDGTLDGAEFQVNTYTTDNQWYPSVAMDADGDFVVAWESEGQDGSGYGIYAQRYHSDGTRLGGEFRVNTYTTNNQALPRVAMDDDGDFVVAWQSVGQDGSDAGVYAQRYRSNGTRVGGEFQVNTYTDNWQSLPSVAMDADGDFVVAWTDEGGHDGSGYGMYAQRYHSDGTPDGSEFQVNTHTADNQLGSVGYSVAMDADGDFVVAWESDGQDGSGYGIYAQRYHSDGTPDGVEFQVNTYTTSYQTMPSVAMDADGDFVVAWSSDGQDGSGYGVYAQRYHSDGTPDGGEFQVNTYTNDTQYGPSVTMDADGDFAAAWSSYSQDGDASGVYAQRYAPNIPTLTLAKTVDDALPDPGQLITFTLTIANSSFLTATHALVSDSLPSELNFVGPITLDPSGAGALGTEPPVLVSELTISPNTCVTLTFPVTVDLGLAKGTTITNTASITSSEVITPQIRIRAVTIPLDFYLPIVLKNSS